MTCLRISWEIVVAGFLPLLPCRKNFLPLFIYPCNMRFICLLVHPSTIAALFLLAVSGWSANPFITSYFFCSFIDKTTFLISLLLLFNKMYKELFYHKQDIFVWGILGLYHIRLIFIEVKVDFLLTYFKKVVIIINCEHSYIITCNEKRWLSLAIFFM